MQQNKNKRTKNNKGNNFLRMKSSRRGKIGYFEFLKKIEIVLISLFTILHPSTGTHKTLWPNRQG